MSQQLNQQAVTVADAFYDTGQICQAECVRKHFRQKEKKETREMLFTPRKEAQDRSQVIFNPSSNLISNHELI